MHQDVLIERIVESLGLYYGMVFKKHTPLGGKPLIKDKDGPPAHVNFSYMSVVVMLLYLVGHTRPNIVYAVNCCTQYVFAQDNFYELSLNPIGRYLK